MCVLFAIFELSFNFWSLTTHAHTHTVSFISLHHLEDPKDSQV